MVRHYVEFYYPGSLFAETSTKEVARRDPALVKLPKGAYGFRFFDRTEIEEGGETLMGERKNFSRFTYYGEEWPLERIERELPNERILISNIKGNGYKAAVKTIRGNWMWLEKGDRVLAAP